LFLIDKKNKLAVLDYQLIYDTDSLIHLDFYCDGIIKEINRYVPNARTEKLGPGMMCLDLKDYTFFQAKLSELVHDQTELKKLLSKMVGSIKPVHTACRKVECQFKSNQIHLYDYLDLYAKVINMMSYKQISDQLESKLIISESRTPSYLIRFYRSIKQLSLGLTEQKIENFIERHGFLYSFSILETELESKTGLKLYLDSKKEWPEIKTVKKKAEKGAPSSLFGMRSYGIITN
jgi:hypothetical protein